MSKDLFHTICIAWAGIAVATFVLLLFVKAPYGRHVTKGWGPQISNKLGWILMELPSFGCILYFFVYYGHSAYASFLLILWLVHYANRTFVFPLRIRTRGKKMPLIIVISAVAFNLVNAGLNGYYLSFFEHYSSDEFLSWQFLFGIVIFITGALINLKSDHILINLRKPTEAGYKIPKGFLFESVSCPNHLGEIIQWGGFALMAWNCPAATFFLWTAANLVPRALNHHRWYKQHFEEYPAERKALFPKIL
jgi:hypothetical protein